jgi:hypothetical protein
MAALPRLMTKWLIALGLMIPAGHLFAYNETLSFRITPSGTIEAVVSGLNDGPSCQTEFVPPNSVIVGSNTITITSPYTFYFCGLPASPVHYEVVADLGVLTGSSYQVTWSEGPLMVSATLVPSALTPNDPNPVPAMSWPSIVMSALAVALAATWRQLKIRRRAGES